MYNFNKKQKIILGILVAIVAVFIFYYVYAKDENTNEKLELENNIEIQEEEVKEEYIDDTILVHVSGAVVKEGLIELKVESRISDAIDKAGGVREDASTEDINLAYKLEDGMKIHIPTKEEKANAISTNTIYEEDKTDQYITTSSGVSDTTNNEKVKNTKVNINTATQSLLETLPGIGTSTATKIINYRNEKGKFVKIEDIKEVSGIGDAKFEKIKDLISVK